MKNVDPDTPASAVQALSDAIVWEHSSIPGVSVATCTDDATINERDLLTGLSDDERQRTQKLTDPVERRHFIVRRCFQRIFVKSVLNAEMPLEILKLAHHQDTRPLCEDAPSLQLSFSSSAETMLACASMQFSVGVDIEKLRPINNVTALAHRFFTAEEATAIQLLPAEQQNLAFLKHWTAKEAGLKATGKGIVSGLNNFVLKLQSGTYSIESTVENDFPQSWNLNYLALSPGHVVAVVHSLEK